jgi:hypothetical protein
VTSLLLAVLVLFTDASKTQPLFVPAAAFSAPRRFGLTNAQIEQFDRDMNAVRETRKAIGDDPDSCSTPIAPTQTTITAKGTILDAVEGWNTRRRYVTTLAKIRIDQATRGDIKPGDELLVELPFGAMQLGRTRWCTGKRSVKVGDAIAFEAERTDSEPAALIGVVR